MAKWQERTALMLGDEDLEKLRKAHVLIVGLGGVGAYAAEQLCRDINPELNLCVINEYLKDKRMIEILHEAQYDYVVDAIDTLAPKTFLIYHSVQANLPIVSSMGAGGKFDPAQVQQADLSKSYNCRLAKMIRKRLYKLGIRKGVKVIFSPEAR